MAVMQDIIRDTRSHAGQVDQLFHDIIDRTRKALTALRSEHAAVCQQIQETEETASDLRGAIGAQDAPLGSTIQQLARRTARPNVEFCRYSNKINLINLIKRGYEYNCYEMFSLGMECRTV